MVPFPTRAAWKLLLLGDPNMIVFLRKPSYSLTMYAFVYGIALRTREKDAGFPRAFILLSSHAL
jgi:hypothetical protein